MFYKMKWSPWSPRPSLICSWIFDLCFCRQSDVFCRKSVEWHITKQISLFYFSQTKTLRKYKILFLLSTCLYNIPQKKIIVSDYYFKTFLQQLLYCFIYLVIQISVKDLKSVFNMLETRFIWRSSKVPAISFSPTVAINLFNNFVLDILLLFHTYFFFLTLYRSVLHFHINSVFG